MERCKLFYYLLFSSIVFLTTLSVVQAQDEVTIELLSSEQIEQSKLSFAKDMAHKLLSGMKEGNYHNLNKDQALEEIRTHFTAKRQKEFYTKVSNDLGGDYTGKLTFQEAYFVNKPDDYPDLYMFRFKDAFPDNAEVRIYVDKYDNIVSGFLVTLWVDKIYRYKSD
jgi:hypothetical protein